MKDRIEWIDFIKGYLIISVVFLHICNGYDKYHLLLKIITCFHMFMFFSITGFLTDFEKANFKNLISKKFKSLLIPYIIWGGIIAIPFEILKRIIQNETISITLLIKNFLTFYNTFSPTWFLSTLFLVILLEFLINKFFKNNYSIIIINILFLIIGLCIPVRLNAICRLKTTLVACFFFELGYIINKRKFYCCKTFYGIIMFIIGILFCIPNKQVVASDAIYGNPIYFTISTMLIIIGLYIISSKINKIPKLISIFGKNSIIVLCIHPMIIYSIRIIEKILKLATHTIPILICFIYTIIFLYIAILFCKKYLMYTFGINKSSWRKETIR